MRGLLCSGKSFLYTFRIEKPVQPLRRTALNAEKSVIYAQSKVQLFLMLKVEYTVETVLPHYRWLIPHWIFNILYSSYLYPCQPYLYVWCGLGTVYGRHLSKAVIRIENKMQYNGVWDSGTRIVKLTGRNSPLERRTILCLSKWFFKKITGRGE